MNDPLRPAVEREVGTDRDAGAARRPKDPSVQACYLTRPVLVQPPARQVLLRLRILSREARAPAARPARRPGLHSDLHRVNRVNRALGTRPRDPARYRLLQRRSLGTRGCLGWRRSLGELDLDHLRRRRRCRRRRQRRAPRPSLELQHIFLLPCPPRAVRARLLQAQEQARFGLDAARKERKSPRPSIGAAEPPLRLIHSLTSLLLRSPGGSSARLVAPGPALLTRSDLVCVLSHPSVSNSFLPNHFSHLKFINCEFKAAIHLGFLWVNIAQLVHHFSEVFVSQKSSEVAWHNTPESQFFSNSSKLAFTKN